MSQLPLRLLRALTGCCCLHSLDRTPTGLIPTAEISFGSRQIPQQLPAAEPLVLYESNTIVRYLASKAPGALHDGTDEGFARASVWMDVALAKGAGERLLTPVGYPLHSHTLRHPPEEREEAVAVAARDEFVAEAQTMLEPALGRQPYLGGADFSMADIPIGCLVNRARPTHARLGGGPLSQRVRRVLLLRQCCPLLRLGVRRGRNSDEATQHRCVFPPLGRAAGLPSRRRGARGGALWREHGGGAGVLGRGGRGRHATRPFVNTRIQVWFAQQRDMAKRRECCAERPERDRD